jgi:TctA family transporter
MLQAIGNALMAMMNINILFYLTLGTSIGLIIGVIPGLGGLFALSILIPFALIMDLYEGIAFLLSAHAVINTSGSITSILFGTPGSPGTAATVFDGYPMCQKGEAGRALGANIAASVLGGVFGGIFLALLVPFVRPLVLSLGAPEMFMLAMVGISLMSVVGSGSPVKALMSGFLGFLIATIGLDPILARPRYTFGLLELWDGIGMIPVAIGLFALAEMLDLTVKGAVAISEVKQRQIDVWYGILETFRHWWLVLRCGILGAVVGAIPGLGGDVANFVAYGHAKQTSKHPEEFGQGNIEGVIGPESANNAKEGGALLPTLGFGIPGSAAMAILLGVFMIWGVQPGPAMLAETKGLTLVFFMVYVVMFSNILGGIGCHFLSYISLQLTNLRASLMIPSIIILGTLGAFAFRNSLVDVMIAYIFAALGYAMKKVDFSRGVLLIGMVLGSIAERYFSLSFRLYSWGFLIRPIVIVLIIVIIVTLLTPYLNKAMMPRRRGVKEKG